MILLKLKESGPIPGHDEKTGIKGRRWVLETHRCGLYFSFQTKKGDEWFSSHMGYYGIGLQKDFKINYDTCYYDGDHYVINLGFIYLTWYR